jgi:DNA-binding LytR/AlgR family response regulator
MATEVAKRPLAIVAEDEPVLRDQLREILGAVWPALNVECVANGLDAIRLLELRQPDVMFLDIHMPEASGLEVARHASSRCHVVFVTAYDQHAVSAFEAGAVDYVMKPLSVARVALAADRVRARLHVAPAPLGNLLERLAAAPRGNGQYLRWINTSQAGEIQLITTDEIVYFQSDAKYTRVIARHGEGLIRKSVRELSEELDPMVFWRIHRSTIANLNAVAGVAHDAHGHLVLKLKDRAEVLHVSQPYAHLFRQM